MQLPQQDVEGLTRGLQAGVVHADGIEAVHIHVVRV